MIEKEGEINTDLGRSNDWEWELAGHLIGTWWDFPQNDAGDEIIDVSYSTEREQGFKQRYPEVHFIYSNIRLPVSGFKRRIDPNDVGDVEPAGQTAKRLVDVYFENDE